MLLWKYFLLAFTALLPLINPIGSALVFLGLVGEIEPREVYWRLARKIGVATVAFLIVIEFMGSLLLSFFGISLPIVQVAGGLVIAATAWALLFEKDSRAHDRDRHEEIANDARADNDLDGKVFYPFTFPLTAGPGTLVVMLTLSAHASENNLTGKALAHGGIALAVVVLSASVFFCYGYAPKLIKKISPSVVHGILRVIAFVLMCIGVQIAWNGLSLLWASLLFHK